MQDSLPCQSYCQGSRHHCQSSRFETQPGQRQPIATAPFAPPTTRLHPAGRTRPRRAATSRRLSCHCTESSTSSQTVNDAPDQDRTSGLIPTAAPGRSRRRCIRPPAAGGYVSDAFARRDAVTNSRLPREPQKSSRHGGMPRASAVRSRRTAWACVAPPRNARATELDGHGVYRWENVDRLNPVTL